MSKSDFAVVSISGHQYKVSPGDTIDVSHQSQKPGELVYFPALLVNKDGKIQVGTPLLDIKVEAKIVDHKKGEKIRVATYKAKSRYRKVKGFRSSLTSLLIQSIGEKAPVREKKSAPTATKVRKTKAKSK